jgi:hypothetical protein
LGQTKKYQAAGLVQRGHTQRGIHAATIRRHACRNTIEPKEVQMQKKASLLIGLTLVALGVLALAANLLIRANGVGFLLGFRAWPIIVVGAVLLLCIPPFLFP